MKIKTYDGHKNVTGVVIKQAREEKGLTKKALCERLQLYNVHINRNELTFIENDKLMVKDFDLLAIAAILYIDLNTLRNHLDN